MYTKKIICGAVIINILAYTIISNFMIKNYILKLEINCPIKIIFYIERGRKK